MTSLSLRDDRYSDPGDGYSDPDDHYLDPDDHHPHRDGRYLDRGPYGSFTE